MPDLYVDIAEAMSLEASSADDAVSQVLGAIKKLSSDVGIPRNLKELASGGGEWCGGPLPAHLSHVAHSVPLPPLGRRASSPRTLTSWLKTR